MISVLIRPCAWRRDGSTASAARGGRRYRSPYSHSSREFHVRRRHVRRPSPPVAEARRAHARTHRRTPADAEIPAAAERSIGGATRNAAAASRLSATLKYLSIPPPPLPPPVPSPPPRALRPFSGGATAGARAASTSRRYCYVTACGRGLCERSSTIFATPLPASARCVTPRACVTVFSPWRLGASRCLSHDTCCACLQAVAAPGCLRHSADVTAGAAPRVCVTGGALTQPHGSEGRRGARGATAQQQGAAASAPRLSAHSQA